MANETWQPVTTIYIETRTQDERKYSVTAIIHCVDPLNIAICHRVEEPRYPELDASVEAGEELERWKERCHALEVWVADAKSVVRQQQRLIERLNALLPDAETRRAGDRLGAIVTNTVITPDDYADLTMIRKWLDKLKGEIGE